MTHGAWLRNIVNDLLQKAKGENPKVFFPVLSRIIKGHDLSIPSFLLPFTVLNVVLGGTESEISSIEEEMLKILKFDVESLGSMEA